MEDQLEALERSADITGGGQINLANLTDGLRAEREQGITIDVAYRYFATPHRKFIVADTPGHVQYTRNMVTGASTANLSIVLVDARQGVIEQTPPPHLSRRAARHSAPRHRRQQDGSRGLERGALPRNPRRDRGFPPEARLFHDVKFIPISALNGDNVVDASQTHAVVSGPDVARASGNRPHRQRLEPERVPFPGAMGEPPEQSDRSDAARFPRLQRPDRRRHRPQGPDRSSCCPAASKTTVKEIWTYDGSLAEAFCPQSVTLCLEHDIDISRGDMIVGLENLPGMDSDLHAHICWMHPRPLQLGKKYFLKHTTQTVQAIVTSLESRINMATFEPEPDTAALAMNDIGVIRLKTAKPLMFDGYSTNRLTGSFILIEQGTNATVAAGMLSPPTEAVKPEYTDFAI